ncbi:MAG: hypothetical protein KDA63_10865 [Planctomycetales bacterium]|nr:hypothetical protein [Planctomycetales bacterium]
MSSHHQHIATRTRSAHARWVPAWGLAAALLTGACLQSTAHAQPTHRIYHDQMPPGDIGMWQVQSTPSLAGHFQPVEIRLPDQAAISIVVDNRFEENRSVVTRVGLLVGRVYRFKVTGIPLAEGMEVFPTIEVIDRLCPPPGQEWKFPVPVEITQEELRMALDGKYVTRVIYVEDPELAIPASYTGQEQPWFDVGEEGDALETADILGRPIAILRLGGRVPIDPTKLSPEFTFGSPPLVRVSSKRDASLEQYDKALKQALDPGTLRDTDLMSRLLRLRKRDEALRGTP